MIKIRRIFIAFILCFLMGGSGYADGIEIKLTVSGKLLLGIAYRHQIDPNTAIRLGSYMGVAGAPVGFQLGLVQDLMPTKEWTPTFGIGVDAIIFKKNNSFSKRIYPSAVCGLSYCPGKNTRHSGELWLGWLEKSLQPIGMNYLHLTKLF